MIFTTYWFYVFAVAFFPVCWLIRLPWLRLGWLLIACFVFHAHFAGAAGVAPIIVLGSLTFAAGLNRRRWVHFAAIGVVALALIVYKYSHFLAHDVVGAWRPELGQQFDHLLRTWLPATPPLAISFFTFEFVHYLYDVAHGSPPIRRPTQFAAFAFYFPSLVAGPIKRYQPFLETLHAGLARVPLDDVKLGLVRIAVGLGKKIVVADNLTAAIAFWQPQYADLALSARWVLVAAIGLRILMDFSGYTDIALGLALLMGIRLPENFNWPYAATSLQDFWQRWHISLSSWIRDYVYIPLGGNRHGLVRKIVNAIVAFGLCGLWHGPAWNFVIWGLLHGVGLAVQANYRTVPGVGAWLATTMARLPLLAWALTMLFVFVGWLYFFYPVPEATRMLRLLFVTKI